MSVKAGQAQWDKRPPEVTRAQRRAAAAARPQAEHLGWCKPLALDEDALDEPGYRPRSRYRAAIGSGTAGECQPRTGARTEQAAFASCEEAER